MKRNIALLAILTALAAILALGTGAYFTASGQATNVVTTGTVSLSLDERRADGQVFPDLTADVLPGQSVSKIPYVVNTGSQPFYTRMLIQVSGGTRNARPGHRALGPGNRRLVVLPGRGGSRRQKSPLYPGNLFSPDGERVYGCADRRFGDGPGGPEQK